MRLSAADTSKYDEDQARLRRSLAATEVADRIGQALGVDSPRVMMIDGEFALIIPVDQLAELDPAQLVTAST